jgi:hypothetical protein
MDAPASTARERTKDGTRAKAVRLDLNFVQEAIEELQCDAVFAICRLQELLERFTGSDKR